MVLHFFLAQRRKVDALEFDRARRDVTVAGQETHDGQARRRLATARLPDETDAFTRVDVE